MSDRIAAVFATGIYLGYLLGPFFGIFAAVQNGSFLNALLSLFIPYYGVIYFFLA